MPPSHDALVQALAAKNFAAVEKYAREALVSHADSPSLWQTLGVAQLRLQRVVDAIGSFQRAISHGGDNAILHFELACAFEQAAQWHEAVTHLQRAATFNPPSVEVLVNLTALLEKTDRLEEALSYGRQATMLHPRHPVVHYNLANVLQSLGRLDDAIAEYSKAIEIDPEFALAYTNRGCCHLLQGNDGDGWPDYEWRLRTPQVQLVPFPQPRWHGQPLPQGTLLVHGEQGIGDEILFASCLPEVVTKVGKCVFVCDPRLSTLMARSFPAITVVGHSRQSSNSLPQLPLPIDAQISSGSLPLYLRTDSKLSLPKAISFGRPTEKSHVAQTVRNVGARSEGGHFLARRRNMGRTLASARPRWINRARYFPWKSAVH